VRRDGTFIGVEVDDSVSGDPQLAQRLAEACPVDIYAAAAGGVEIVDANLDECVLCGLCLDASPPDAVRVIKLYDGGAVLERAATIASRDSRGG
jgi:NAD-dependent dihydropyrimidine dehydrogenase PreA subunit